MSWAMSIDFAALLTEVVERKASDLHIAAGARPTIRIRGQLIDGCRKFVNRLGEQEIASLTGDDHFPGAVHVVAHDGFPGNQPLRQHAGQSFSKAGVNHDVHGG